MGGEDVGCDGGMELGMSAWRWRWGLKVDVDVRGVGCEMRLDEMVGRWDGGCEDLCVKWKKASWKRTFSLYLFVPCDELSNFTTTSASTSDNWNSAGKQSSKLLNTIAFF